jgi:hypothetical protein
VSEVAFFSTDWHAEKPPGQPDKRLMTFGGTFFYRGAMPAAELAKHGWETHLCWRFEVAPDGHIRTMDPEGNWHDPDVFWSQRWMKRDADQMIRRARATGQKCIADLDDAFQALPKTNLARTTTDPKNNPDFNREHYWKMLPACDAVTVSTAPLQREMQRLGVPAYIIRNAIDLQQWQPKDPGDEGMIGWVGGIQWRAHDIQILRSIGLPRFLAEHNLPVYHGGDSQVPGVPKFWELAGIDPQVTSCAALPLCHIAEYPKLWNPVGVALVPLERVRFNEAKSFLKSLEASAAGVPYIVSAGFPEQDLLIAEGTAGRVARNEQPREWRTHLEALMDPDVRRAEGKINRSVAEGHDIKQRWVDWDMVFRQIIG